MPNYEYMIVPTNFNHRDAVLERARLAIQLELDKAGKNGFKVISFDPLSGSYTLMREMQTPYEYQRIMPDWMTKYSAKGWEFVAVIPSSPEAETEFVVRRELNPASVTVPYPDDYGRSVHAFMGGLPEDYVPRDIVDAEILQDEP